MVDSMVYGKVIELFLVNGTADSLVIAELSNWNGQAVKIPRIEITECDRDEIKGPGVYFLFCKEEEEEKDAVYIGESENLKLRLVQHMQDYSAGKEKYYWNTAVLFTGTGLNKALIRYLEDRLVKMAKEANRYTVLTKSTYGKTILKESAQATMEEFLDKIKVLINAMGYKVLEPVISSSENNQKTLYLKMGDAEAKGVITAEGFVVFKGAKLHARTSEKSLSTKAATYRNKMMNSKNVVDLHTTEDLLFSSSSAAADFVVGFSVSGPQTWKDQNGTPLKELNIDS